MRQINRTQERRNLGAELEIYDLDCEPRSVITRMRDNLSDYLHQLATEIRRSSGLEEEKVSEGMVLE